MAEALLGNPPPPGNGMLEASKGAALIRLSGVRQRPMLTGEGQAEWLRWYAPPPEEDDASFDDDDLE